MGTQISRSHLPNWQCGILAKIRQQKTDVCKSCTRGISGQYFRVTARLACARCVAQTEKPTPKDTHLFSYRIGFLGFGAQFSSRLILYYPASAHHRYCYWGYVLAGHRLDYCQSHQGRLRGIGGRRSQVAAASLTYVGRLHGRHSDLSSSGQQAKSPKPNVKRQTRPCSPGNSDLGYSEFVGHRPPAGSCKPLRRGSRDESFQIVGIPCSSWVSPRRFSNYASPVNVRSASSSFRSVLTRLAPRGWPQNRYPRPFWRPAHPRRPALQPSPLRIAHRFHHFVDRSATVVTLQRLPAAWSPGV